MHDYNAYLACTTGSGGAINSSDETAPQRYDAAPNNPLNANYTINQTNDAANVTAGGATVGTGSIINTGDEAIIVPPWNVDAAGNARPYNGLAPSMGAYEYIGGATQYNVTPTQAGSGCTMSPNVATPVISGQPLQLTSSCQNGFQATWSASGGSDCGGSASAPVCANNVCVTTYTTAAVTGNCGKTMTGGAIPILPWLH